MAGRHPAAALREDFSLRTAIVRLLPNIGLPIDCRDGAEPGRKFCFERRYWEHAILKADRMCGFGKLETQRNVITKLTAEYSLCGFDVLHPLQLFQPMLMSCRACLCWAITRWHMSILKNGASCLAPRWARFVSDIFVAACLAVEQLEERPSLSVGAETLSLCRDGRVDVGGLCAGPWPTLEVEWNTMANIPYAVLGQLPDTKIVRLEELYWFVSSRCLFSSEPVGAGHHLKLIRAALIDLTTWLVDVHVYLAIVEALARKDDPEPTVLVGARGCRVKVCTWACYGALRRVVHAFGSDQTTVSALGFRRGDAAVMRAVLFRLYAERAASELAHASSISACWDGSCHGGLETLVGCVSSCVTGRSFYLRPQASM